MSSNLLSEALWCWSCSSTPLIYAGLRRSERGIWLSVTARMSSVDGACWGLGVSVCYWIAACRTRCVCGVHTRVCACMCTAGYSCVTSAECGHEAILVSVHTVSTCGSDVIQSSVVVCYLNVLCWIAFLWLWPIYYISCSLQACFCLLV